MSVPGNFTLLGVAHSGVWVGSTALRVDGPGAPLEHAEGGWLRKEGRITYICPSSSLEILVAQMARV